MLLRTALAIFAIVVIPTSAFSQWVFQQRDSAFSDDSMVLMMTQNRSHAFGVRCEKGEVEIVYITNEEIDDESAISALDPQINIRIDDNKITAYKSIAQKSDDKKLVLMAKANLDLVNEIKDAKRRVAVVVYVLGSPFHEQSFRVFGSTKAANQFLEGCK